MMNRDRLAYAARQKTLEFAREGSSPELPSTVREEAQSLIARFLVDVVRRESEIRKEKTENERQDSR